MSKETYQEDERIDILSIHLKGLNFFPNRIPHGSLEVFMRYSDGIRQIESIWFSRMLHEKSEDRAGNKFQQKIRDARGGRTGGE